MPETTKQVFRITIRASIQQVWDTLTTEGEPLPFFFGSVPSVIVISSMG